MKPQPITVYRTGFGECAVPELNATCLFSLVSPIMSCSMIMRLILWCLWKFVFILNNTLILGILRSAISHLPGCFLSLDLLSEYRIQHGTVGPLYVTSRYSTRIFYRGVSGFATDCPCGVWCRGLTTCLLLVHFLEIDFWTTVGLKTYVFAYVLIHHMISWLYLYILNNVFISISIVPTFSIDLVFTLSLMNEP